ncbi:hypothetical protein GCM10009760_40600 [Kitasatospora kazusensis]|uniref:LysM domain-containing protein n=1 Tax=Kitasatospora kazusensis TaxID=407974 RepID=A0ABP5LJH4_9ACTN
MAAPRAKDHAHAARKGAPVPPAPPGRRPVPLKAHRGRRTAGSLAAAFGALLLLGALLAGLPALLLYGTTAVLRMGGASSGGFLELLTSPDDGRLFLWALVAVGWVAWLCFATAVLLEIPAQLRGRTARRLPAFGWSQRLAAGLVGSVIALLPVAGSAFAAVPERAPAVSAPAQLAASPQYAALPAAQAAPALAPAAAAQPTYTVRDTRPADSLWSIAERQLGSGDRWTEIAKLNNGRQMDDSGDRFDADRSIQPGWKLLMPSDAKPDAEAGPVTAAPQPPAATPAPGAAGRQATVRSGDTLSAIAEREMGSSQDWPQLFEANKGVRGPDGEQLTDPDVLVPGMVLTVPGTAPAPAPPVVAPPVVAPPVTAPPVVAPPSPAPVVTPAPVPSAGSAPIGRAPSSEPADSAPPAKPSVPAKPTAPAKPTTPAKATAPAAATAPSGDYTVALAASTVGVLLAAVMIGAVSRRRGDQQRARRPRHRIALPAQPAAAFEAELKVRQSAAGMDLLDRALRTLARNTVRSGKRLPALVAVRVTPGRTVELHLSAPAAPVAPFRAAHAPNVWWCPEDSSELLSASQAAKSSAPYPALVTLGCAPDGSVVLADLETVRLMHLSGHPDDARDVLRTLAVELAHSPLADRLHLHLVGIPDDPAISGPAAERVHRYDTLQEALTALGPRTARARATLVAAEATSPREARSRGHADESWVPEIVLSVQPPSGNLPAELGRLLDGTPRTCLAVVARAPERGSGPVARWTLPSTGLATIPGLHLGVELQRLNQEQYDQWGELLRSSGDSTQHPAPDWTLDGPGADADTDELPLPEPVLVSVGARREDPAVQPVTARVIGTGASPFAGISPVATPEQRSVRLNANSRGLHAAKNPEPPETAQAPAAPQAPAPLAGPPAVPAVSLVRPLPPVPPAAAPAPAPAAPPVEPNPTHDPAPAPDGPGAPAAQTRPTESLPTAPPAPVTAASVRTDSDDLLAILRSPEAHSARTAPRIRLLGPVDILGASGAANPEAVPRLTELAVLLALRPGVDHDALDRALHPGAAHLDPHLAEDRPPTPLPGRIAELVSWFGSSADGRAFLTGESADAPDGYAFAPTVTCDWDEFRSLYRRGMRSTSSTADAALAHALALVRGAPFAEAPAQAYGWAEPERQDMLAAIVDTAHELAARRLQYGDHRSAEAAIFRGLAVAPDVELLHRDLFYAYASAGARDQLVRAVNRLDALSRRTGRALDPDTVALLRDLLTGG